MQDAATTGICGICRKTFVLHKPLHNNITSHNEIVMTLRIISIKLLSPVTTVNEVIHERLDCTNRVQYFLTKGWPIGDIMHV